MGFYSLFYIFLLLILISSNCGPWRKATMSGYDNLTEDDKHPGELAEYTGTTAYSLSHIPVASILQRDWHSLRYSNINIKYKGDIKTVQSWDECSDNDCGKDDPHCCTRNAKKFGGNFLLDIEKRTLFRLFGISNFENVLEGIEFQICGKFDPEPIAIKYGLKK